MAIIYGRNPIVEAMRSAQSVEKLYLLEGLRPQGVIEEIIRRARSQRIPTTSLDRRALDRISDGANHQGVVAEVGEYDYAEMEEILVEAQRRSEKPLLLLLDSIQDIQNLGTLIRTAEAVGAHGVVIPRHRAASVNSAVVKASAGAVEHLLIARVANLSRAIDELKSQGVWIVGLAGESKTDFEEVDYTAPTAVVVGSEGSGLSRLVAEKCDYLVQLPMRGKVESLNAAVAGSLVLYTAFRKRERASSQPTIG